MAGDAEIERVAKLMSLAGNDTRLKLVYALEILGEVRVSDLSTCLGVSASAVSQHLAKLKARGMVGSRRDAQTIYYRLAENDFNETLRQEFFSVWAR